MARGARSRAGYEYLAITDHSASHGFGDHVTPEALRAPDRARSRALNASLDGLELLVGTEVNILPDGSLDYDGRAARAARLGDRVDPHVVRDGRAGDDRPHDRRDRAPVRRRHRPPDGAQDRDARRPTRLDIERVIEAAARTGTMIEINAAPDRRDLNEIHARAAAEAGRADPGRLRRPLGAQLRRCCATGSRPPGAAWLTAEQVANTRPWAEFAPLRKRVR